MTEHESIQNLLALREGLSPDEEEQVRAHLRGCRQCDVVAAEYARQDAFLRAIALPEPSSALRQGVYERVSRPRNKVWWSPVRGRLLSAALGSIAVALIAAVLVHLSAGRKSAAVQSPRAAAPAPAFGPLAPSHQGANKAAYLSMAAPTVTTISHGVKLSLIVPGSVYPQNALVPVTLVLRNVSKRTILPSRGNDLICGTRAPWAQVVTPGGNVLYPPAMPAGGGPSCGAWPMGPQLSPGHLVRRQFLVVLRSNRIRGVVSLPGPYGEDIRVQTAPVQVRLIRDTPPRVRLVRSPGVYADIRPGSPSWSGPLRYVYYWACGADGGLQEGLDQWMTVRATRFEPGCTHPYQWDLVAGWLGHPVATIDYRRARNKGTKKP